VLPDRKKNYSFVTHMTFTESPQRLWDQFNPFCQYKSLLLLGFLLSQSNPILHLSGCAELQGPKTADRHDPKNVTHVSLKEAGRA